MVYNQSEIMNREKHLVHKNNTNKPFSLKKKYNENRDITGKCKSVARTFITKKIANQEHWQ